MFLQTVKMQNLKLYIQKVTSNFENLLKLHTVKPELRPPPNSLQRSPFLESQFESSSHKATSEQQPVKNGPKIFSPKFW